MANTLSLSDYISDGDILREVTNTVGRPGKLGAYLRCVVSVSMLTEGWDANTVTHICGVRAFLSQLLCEQVVGRALRRMQSILQPSDKDCIRKFSPEYAQIIGIPFRFFKGGNDDALAAEPEVITAYRDTWELTNTNPRSGLVGILLPTHPSFNSPNYNRHIIPPRLYDNSQNGFAKLYDWNTNPAEVERWIHEAFLNRNNPKISPNLQRELFKNNRTGNQWQ